MSCWFGLRLSMECASDHTNDDLWTYVSKYRKCLIQIFWIFETFYLFIFFPGWLIKIGMMWRKKTRICNGIVHYYIFKLFMFFCLREQYCKLWCIPLSEVSLRSYISSTPCYRCPSNFSWWQTSWNINRFCEWSLMDPYLEDST